MVRFASALIILSAVCHAGSVVAQTSGLVQRRAAVREATRGPIAVKEAVDVFNAIVAQDPTGQSEPLLSQEEVVAAIRGWIPEMGPRASRKVYEEYQKIADTRRLPQDACLSFTTGWHGYKDYEFDVWWIDMHIPTGEKTGYTFRIRERFLRCRPLAEQQ